VSEGTAPNGTPTASTMADRFMPCLPRSSGEPPAISPPPGALVRQPSTLTSRRSRPISPRQHQDPRGAGRPWPDRSDRSAR
jgi:hypothetical protein